MSRKMTALQWLEIAMQNKLKAEMGPYFAEAFEQAKEMEKQQIMDAYDSGEANQYRCEHIMNSKDCSPEEYYTSIFNS
jgi:hypothetical protein